MAHRLPLADYTFIASFAAFCRSKGDEEYHSWDPRRCALAMFGYRNVDGGSCAERGVPFSAYYAAALARPATFSALADRLEALIADAPTLVQQ